ncbi:hypothetical protein F0562_035568 [Nyssa sinensis]|uniref:Peptidase A1 domain-containing protein n=1 Tax=Nyssa sinensis TaxID=561372 RepID=A0A5J5AG54_9ASTE|nr:hypothetical protein F0562_035568 [Nyssa sinensis]
MICYSNQYICKMGFVTRAFESMLKDCSGGQVAAFPNSVFGCGYDNGGNFNSRVSGLVGLGGGPLSLVSQLATEIDQKFSYCLLPRTVNSASRLKFGTDAVLSGQRVVSTPLISRGSGTFYYLTLEAVSVGDKRIENRMDPNNEGNIIIDSGTTLNLLEPNFYNDIVAAIREAISTLNTVQDPQGNYYLCYDKNSLSMAPETAIVYHFTGADVTLKRLNTFRELNTVSCVAMLPSTRLSIYGNVAQVNFQVLYDLTMKQVSLAPADSKIGGFSIDLVHRDSQLSPFYNHSSTPSDLARHDASCSIARVSQFHSSSIEENKIESIVIPNGGSYLMKFSLGTPPVETFAIADTGSDLIWVQCKPCNQNKCFPQDRPLFDPMKSSTYIELPCDSKPCQALQSSQCDNTKNQCQYSYRYGDKSYTNGVLTTDTFTFDSAGGQAAAFPNSVFGCGYDNGGTFNSRESGLVGLGGGPLSLVSQLATEIDQKFSYCLLPRTVNSASKLKFGTDAVLSGQGVVSTPLKSRGSGTFYYLTLEAVSVGDKRIENRMDPNNEGADVTLKRLNTFRELNTIILPIPSPDPSPSSHAKRRKRRSKTSNMEGGISIYGSSPVLEASNGAGFTVDLIHRDSPLSPFYNPSTTPTDRLRNAILRSTLRSTHFNPSSSSELDPMQSEIISDNGEYLMKLSIGTPPVQILAIADTGSDLTWTQCVPCAHCFTQNAPFFVPSKSSTYRELSCQSPRCEADLSTNCRVNDNVCQYRMSYGDKSFSFGDLAADTFTFGSTSGQPTSIPKVVFGCGHNNGGTFNGSESGIIGLGGGKLSIINQLDGSISGKFSYCLVPLYEGTNVTSKINFGSNAVVSGHGAVSTPLVTKKPDTFYYLTLKAISVGNKRVSYKTFSEVTAAEEGNIIIDSGTTLTLIPGEFYNDLESALIDVIKAKRSPDPYGLLGLCYRAEEEFDAPKITVHFAGADLELPAASLFIKVQDDLACLTMVPSDSLAIFGNLWQMNMLVGYDLVEKKVSFMPTDCTKH